LPCRDLAIPFNAPQARLPLAGMRYNLARSSVNRGKLMKNLHTGAVALFLAFALCAASTPSRADDAATAASTKVKGLLDRSGYKYKTHKPNVWSIDFDKKNLGKEVVIISTNDTLIVTFVILAKDAQIRKTGELMSKLLTADHEYDYVKVGFDGDGDMFVRIDAPVRVTDATR
jgi:hypothetical protein